MEQPNHVILKWNEMPFFHSDAPDTIYRHAKLLQQFSRSSEEQYVWWGKISVSGYLGNIDSYIDEINTQASLTDVYLYLYCPDSPHPTMHVGRLSEISCQDQTASEHTPSYYRDVSRNFNIPYWFKLKDIAQIPLYDTIQQLSTVHQTPFDPVRVNYYPMVVRLQKYQQYFCNTSMYLSLLGGHEMKCFKTGSDCSCINHISYHPDRVFIGCPFEPPFLNMVSFAIKPVMEEKHLEAWIACDSVSNIDIMCKICQAIQSSGRAIIDITGWNPNVLFELGLLYGNAKNVLLIKQKGHSSPVDLNGIEYLEYDPNDFSSLQQRLRQFF